MLLEKLKEQYMFVIEKWLARNKYTVSEHVKEIIVSILLHRDKIVDYGGQFVQSFMSNNLREVIKYADDDVMANLRTIYQAYHNIDTYEYVAAYKKLLDLTNTEL